MVGLISLVRDAEMSMTFEHIALIFLHFAIELVRMVAIYIIVRDLRVISLRLFKCLYLGLIDDVSRED
jgi:hypothetical protein